MKTKIANFNNIYNNIMSNFPWEIGSSDMDVMTAVHNEFRLQYRCGFSMIPYWELLCNLQSGILYHHLTCNILLSEPIRLYINLIFRILLNE
ncbi:hypothetical protein Hdeb2414_s0028g00700351 [Helianthus debilis subsp. tardiflorus]